MSWPIVLKEKQKRLCNEKGHEGGQGMITTIVLWLWQNSMKGESVDGAVGGFTLCLFVGTIMVAIFQDIALLKWLSK